jgi:hypothetical protein
MSVAELVMPVIGVENDYITLSQAAELAGYKSVRPLQLAAQQGRLKTIKLGPRVQFTTRAWLDQYLAELRQGRYRRGEPKVPRENDDA